MASKAKTKAQEKRPLWILGNFLVVPTFNCKEAREPTGKMGSYL